MTFTPSANYNGPVNFPYVISDVAGLTDTATVTITVNPVDDPPPTITITDEDGAVTPADNSVVEATGATITGSISITAVVGVASLTVAGQDITNASTAPVVIVGTEGTLTITTYDVASGAVTYSYVEDGNAEIHSGGPDSITDVFEVVVTDTEGDVVTDNLDIQIVDTVPVAENDSNSVKESMVASEQIATGNVLTGDSLTGVGTDAVGADANATPIEVFSGATTYGTLDLHADGSYSYQLSSTSIAVTELQDGQSLTDSYTYTITDGDGSTATATLSIVINGADGAPILQGTCMRGDTRSPDLIALDPDEIVTVATNGAVVGGGGANDRLSIDFSGFTSTTTGSATAFSATSFGTVTHQGFEHFSINAADGVTTIATGDGDDIITNTGIGANNLTLGAGNNAITTGGGVNIIDFTNGNNTVNTGGGANTITGTSGHNYIKTGAGVDTITLGGGDNIIKSGDGASTTIAGGGNNFVCAGIDVDTITLGDGNNVVLAGDGANTVIVGNGKNFVIGGTGLDTLTAGDGGNYIDGGPAGANTIVSGSGNDTIFGGIAVDTISAGGGDDRIHILGIGANTVHGEGGSDTLIVDFSDATAAITNAALAPAAPAAGYTGGIAGYGATAYTGIETFDITTGSGADSIFTGDGDDILFGGANDDNLSAAAGDDLLTGGEGNDRLTGGSGVDTFIFKSADGTGSTDTITDFTAGTGGDVLDFSDFLEDEENTGADLANYLTVNFDVVANKSTITANSESDASGSDFTLVLEGVDLVGGGGLNQADILQGLIDSNNLTVDQI
jgi:VCBS repeat-containing protein